jgi:hypothetical protein
MSKTLKIRNVTATASKQYLILWFDGYDQGLVCYEKLLRRLIALYGDDTSDWIGKTVNVVPARWYHEGDDDFDLGGGD